MAPAQPDNLEAKALSWETVFSYQSVGLAFLRTWSLLAFPVTGLYALQFPVTGLYALQSNPLRSMSIAHTVSLCVFACSLLVAPFLLRRITGFRASSFLVASLAVLELGTFGLLLGDTGSTFGSVLLITGAVLTGIGSALINLGYGVSWTRLASSQQALGAAAASTLFAGLLYSYFAGFPTVFMVATVIVCPLVGVLILKANLRSLEVQGSEGRSTLKHLVRPTASALAFGFVLGVMREMYLHYLPSIQIPFSLFRMVISILVFLTVWFGLSRQLSANRIYKFGILGIAFGIIAIVLIPGNFTISYAFLLMGELFFSMVIWTHLSDVARYLKISPVETYGFGLGALYLGYLIGRTSLLGYAAKLDPYNSASGLPIIALLMGIIVLTFYFGLSELSPATEESPQRKPQQFRTKCEIVAQSYELTDRQAEVFMLLVQGKSAKKMQEPLHLSIGTINAHISHIYRKLGIHSREEAIEIVENCELP